jgi:hypothetical protein
MFVLALDAQLIEAKRSGKAAPNMGRALLALDPFVVTKHQPSNGQRAVGPSKNEDTRNDWPHPLHRSQTVVG